MPFWLKILGHLFLSFPAMPPILESDLAAWCFGGEPLEERERAVRGAGRFHRGNVVRYPDVQGLRLLIAGGQGHSPRCCRTCDALGARSDGGTRQRRQHHPGWGRERTAIYVGLTGQRYSTSLAKGLDLLLAPDLGKETRIETAKTLPYTLSMAGAGCYFVIDAIAVWLRPMALIRRTW